MVVAVCTAVQQEQVDKVAGDVNGAAWRRKRGEDQRRDSTIGEAFAKPNLPILDGLYPCGDLVASPMNG